MKAYLMFADRDFDLERELPAQAEALTQDLGLEVLIDAMASGDAFLADVSRHGLLDSLRTPGEIRYRQAVLRDCLDHPDAIRELYDLAVETLARERDHWRSSMFDYPSSVLHRALGVMELYVEMLRRLRDAAERHISDFGSDGFRRFFAMLIDELGDEYLASVESHLSTLQFKKGVLVSAELGNGNRGLGYTLRRPFEHGWLERLTGRGPETYTLRIADRDEAGARALGDLRDQGVYLAAKAASEASAHMLSFFTMLRGELGFFVACLNLDERLAATHRPRCLPDPRSELALHACELYDPGLSLRTDEPVVGNDLDADGATLVLITGANQGGKSTFLRALAVAQLMLQAGMFVAAEEFAADPRTAVFTHYKREEDSELKSGKFDEELHRMSEIADRLDAGATIYFNESFAATDEREGSEVARQIIRALRQAGVRVFFVTHMFDLSDSLCRGSDADGAVFLRAERRDDGARTFRVLPGRPLPTSFGRDLYDRIFAARSRHGDVYTATAISTSRPSATR
jgi:hypothetical protein